ncbi:hypothetical protein HanIR_Chr04g0168621 [Helianthus annuus]|nr:hypothetical protein HanIR_Chr04g0168621 [Helianthus annuus]
MAISLKLSKPMLYVNFKTPSLFTMKNRSLCVKPQQLINRFAPLKIHAAASPGDDNRKKQPSLWQRLHAFLKNHPVSPVLAFIAMELIITKDFQDMYPNATILKPLLSFKVNKNFFISSCLILVVVLIVMLIIDEYLRSLK